MIPASIGRAANKDRQAGVEQSATFIDRPVGYTYNVCMQEKVQKPRQRLVRKQILVTPEQNRRLRELAASSRKPEGALVREALDAWIAAQPATDHDWKKRLMQLAGAWRNLDDDIEARFAELRKSWDRPIDDWGQRSKRRK